MVRGDSGWRRICQLRDLRPVLELVTGGMGALQPDGHRVYARVRLARHAKGIRLDPEKRGMIPAGEPREHPLVDARPILAVGKDHSGPPMHRIGDHEIAE